MMSLASMKGFLLETYSQKIIKASFFIIEMGEKFIPQTNSNKGQTFVFDINAWGTSLIIANWECLERL